MGPHELDMLSARIPEHMTQDAWASVGVVPRALADLFKVRTHHACPGRGSEPVHTHTVCMAIHLKACLRPQAANQAQGST